MRLIERIRMAFRLVKAALKCDSDSIYDEWYCLDPYRTDAIMSSFIRQQGPSHKVIQFQMSGRKWIGQISVWELAEFREAIATKEGKALVTDNIPVKPKTKEKKRHGLRSNRRQNTGKTTRKKRRNDK